MTPSGTTPSGMTPSADEKVILHARALKLAREAPRAAEAGTVLQTVEFLLADERYAIESRRVREVYPLREFTPLPCTPPFILGIVNVRGQIFAILDLRKFFDLPVRGLTELNRVILLEADDMRLGILADAIVGVRSVPLEQVQAPLPTLTGVRGEFLIGVTGERLIVLDAERIMADEALIVHEEVEP